VTYESESHTWHLAVQYAVTHDKLFQTTPLRLPLAVSFVINAISCSGAIASLTTLPSMGKRKQSKAPAPGQKASENRDSQNIWQTMRAYHKFYGPFFSDTSRRDK